jgi:hypothetical protein
MFVVFSVAAGDDRSVGRDALGGEPNDCTVSGKDASIHVAWGPRGGRTWEITGIEWTTRGIVAGLPTTSRRVESLVALSD